MKQTFIFKHKFNGMYIAKEKGRYILTKNKKKAEIFVPGEFPWAQVSKSLQQGGHSGDAVAYTIVPL